MRFGWLVAAAAIAMGAGPAQAARYIEFQVTGSAQLRFGYVTPDGVSGYTVRSIDTFAFDTSLIPDTQETFYGYGQLVQVVAPATAYSVRANFDIGLRGFSKSSPAIIGTSSGSGGPIFRFSFNLSDIAESDILQVLPISADSFQYAVRGSLRTDTVILTSPGQVTSILARSTDIAPASLRASEQLFVTLLPEPASWAMMIGGFGLVGGVMRRRKKLAAKVSLAA